MHLDETHLQLRDMVRQYADENIRPVAGKLDTEAPFPRDMYVDMGKLGMFGITVPEEFGGPGFGNLAYALVMEELARGYASFADQCGLIELISTLLTRHGTPEQRTSLLGPVTTAETLVAYCLTEPEAGTDVAAIRTTARPDGDGWILDGSKIWIHNAPVADIGFVLARTDPKAGHRGMSVCVVDLNAPGVERGPPEKKMGQCASQVGALSFSGVRLGADSLIGEEGRGFHMIMSGIGKGRAGIAALAVGIAQAGLEVALEYSRDRKQFGRSISEFQGIQWKLADMAKYIAAARLLTRDAANRLDRGERAVMACSMAKCFAGDIAVACTSDALQIFGGSGYIRGIEVERLYRDAKITQIYEGTNEIQRTIIARELLSRGAVE